MLIRCHVYGKKNCEGPEGWEDNDELPWFDPKGKYGGEISGAVSKGYSAKEVISFFQKIERFADYCFNKSHAACYSLIGIMSAWLKLHYPTQFWAAVLTVMMDDKDKRARYLELCKQEGIGIDVPDINVSGAGFTPLENKILFGLGAVKKLGKAGLMAILSEREKTGPFMSIANACERLQKKDFKKDTAMNLIKAGAFTFEGQNRYALLNKFLDIRNEKKAARYNEDDWNEVTCIKEEEDVLGIPVTYQPWWFTQKEGDTITEQATVLAWKEHTQKNGKLMCFCTLDINSCKIEAIAFGYQYSNYDGTKWLRTGKEITVTGRKESGKLILSSWQGNLTA